MVRVHGISARHPRRCRDPSTEYPRGTRGGETGSRPQVLDMESTLKDATSKLLRDTGVDEETRKKRARAVKSLAKAFIKAADDAGTRAVWKSKHGSRRRRGRFVGYGGG